MRRETNQGLHFSSCCSSQAVNDTDRHRPTPTATPTDIAGKFFYHVRSVLHCSTRQSRIPQLLSFAHSVLHCSTRQSRIPQLRTSLLRRYNLTSLIDMDQRKSEVRNALTCVLSGEAARFGVAECGFAAWSDGEPSDKV